MLKNIEKYILIAHKQTTSTTSSQFIRFASSATLQIIQTLASHSSTSEFSVSAPSATPPLLQKIIIIFGGKVMLQTINSGLEL